MHDPARIAIFLSGRGSNARAICNAIDRGDIPAQLALIISNSAKAGGLAIAAERGIPGLPLNPIRYPNEALYVAELLRWLQHCEIDLIILAGYLKKLPPQLIAAYPDRILNIHPALLPKHGGPGMYGLRVHQAVLDAHESETGPTIHVVTEHYDEGPVIAQATTTVQDDDTAESLAARVLTLEHRLYPVVIAHCLNALRAGLPLPRLGVVALPAENVRDSRGS